MVLLPSSTPSSPSPIHLIRRPRRLWRVPGPSYRSPPHQTRWSAADKYLCMSCQSATLDITEAPTLDTRLTRTQQRMGGATVGGWWLGKKMVLIGICLFCFVLFATATAPPYTAPKHQVRSSQSLRVPDHLRAHPSRDAYLYNYLIFCTENIENTEKEV